MMELKVKMKTIQLKIYLIRIKKKRKRKKSIIDNHIYPFIYNNGLINFLYDTYSYKITE